MRLGTGLQLRPTGGTDAETELSRRLGVAAASTPRTATVLENWLAQRRERSPFEVVRVPFARVDGWEFAPDSGDLVHRSGRFFTVEGIQVQTDYGAVPQWWQPIIHQPDRAILGILAKEIDGVLHFLLQAKMEPGNVNGVQFSPTVQATSSNYLRAHKGAVPRYVEYFTEPGRARVLVDILQSEQGSWFRGKRNRNIVMEVTGEVPHHDDFVWLTLGEIYDLLRCPNMINMDARTVLSCLPLPATERTGDGSSAYQEAIEVRSWLTSRKADYTLATRQVPLNAVPGWRRGADEIRHDTGKYFAIVGVDVQASNREVRSWCQPLLAPRGTGLVAFIVRRIDGVLHILAHADLRPGYRDTVELGPTVQCTPGNFTDLPAGRRPRYLDAILSGAGTVRYDVLQSEEGGRFHHAVNRHLVVEVGEEFPLATPADYTWLTTAQLKALVRASYQVNIEARSLLLCLHTMR